jgi:hypothetical protein
LKVLARIGSKKSLCSEDRRVWSKVLSEVYRGAGRSGLFTRWNVVGDHGYKQTRRRRRRPQKGAEQQRNKTTIFFWSQPTISPRIYLQLKKNNIENLKDGVGYRNIARKLG